MSKLPVVLVVFFVFAFVLNPSSGQSAGKGSPKMPLEMEALEDHLSYVRGLTKSEMGWPREIEYEHEIYDFKKDDLSREKKTFTLEKKPLRIIPHAVGVSEILWAICPRERIVAFNEFSADPEFSFIADLVKKRGTVFRSKQTELVVGHKPDLVLTVFYSGPDFKEKLKQAEIPYFDLGYFGTIGSIKKQTLLMGKILGEEGNAEALVRLMDEEIAKLRNRLPETKRQLRVLYYDEGGYVPGRLSNFESVCNIIKVTNMGAEQGIRSWARIDYETLLKWDPDIIFVPAGRDLKEQLAANKILSHARAVKKGKVYDIPGRYLSVESQYVLLTANLLAGIVYEDAF